MQQTSCLTKQYFTRAFETVVNKCVDQWIDDIVDEVKPIEYKVPKQGGRFKRVCLGRKEGQTGVDEESHEEDERQNDPDHALVWQLLVTVGGGA